MLAMSWPAIGHAETVYRSVGAGGQVLFSDRPTPGAVAINLPRSETSPARARAARAAAAEMLEVAAVLEASRLRRERLRSERALARQALRLEAMRGALSDEPRHARDYFVPVAGFHHRRGGPSHRRKSPAVEVETLEPSVFAPRPFKPPAFHP